MSNEHTLSAALAFLHAHEGAELAPAMTSLTTRCIDHLVEQNSISLEVAQDLTMQAWGELSASGHRAYIDCNKTTSYTLFLVDDQGTQHTLTIAQLLKLITAATGRP
jgi:hypothetical protein